MTALSHRRTDKSPPRARVITTQELAGPYLEVLRSLDPYLHFKFATIPWLYYVSGAKAEYSVFRKYLAYMREAPNHYIACPEEQLASPNVDRKTLVYQLSERGLNALIERRIIPPRSPSSQRNHCFALHRSNSYKHETIVDLGYYFPLRFLTGRDPALRLVSFPELLQHPNVPLATRESKDPLSIPLKTGAMRLDGTPHVIVRKHRRDASLALGIPGIQVDRTDSYLQIEKHILQAIEFIEGRYYEQHWGFDNCLIPFLFTKEVKKNRAMQFIRKERAKCSFLLFQTIPDYALLRHFPRPEHYDRAYQYKDNEPRHPDNILIFTNPWQRVGFPDFYLNTFDEIGAA